MEKGDIAAKKQAQIADKTRRQVLKRPAFAAAKRLILPKLILPNIPTSRNLLNAHFYQ